MSIMIKKKKETFTFVNSTRLYGYAYPKRVAKRGRVVVVIIDEIRCDDERYI